jgi:hypothetical protein
VTLTASYRFTFTELGAAMRLDKRRMPHRLLLPIFLVVGIANIFFGAWALARPGGDRLFGAEQLLGGLFLISIQWLLRLRDYRHFRRRPDRDLVLTSTFSEEGMEGSYSLGSGKAQWSAFARALASKRGLLLYKDDCTFLWTPASAFADPADYSRLLTLVASKVPKFRHVR